MSLPLNKISRNNNSLFQRNIKLFIVKNKWIIIIFISLFCHLYIFSKNKNEKIWNEILNEDIDQRIIFETIKFSIKETDEDDPELIKFVKSLIQLPASEDKRNLVEKNKKDFSQVGQSKYIDSVLNSKRNGFFIEAGGYDGEDMSNSLFFELERNWTGILIEAIPGYYKQILGKNRKIFSINCCIAKKRPFVAKFQIAEGLSSRISIVNDNFQQRVDDLLSARKKEKKIVYVPCFSLNTILNAINVDKIDYFSLDVEGGELEILKGMDFKNIDITTFSVEHNGYQPARNDIKNFFKDINYTMLKDDPQDVFFIKK
jgi:FkbM family methyltransferase